MWGTDELECIERVHLYACKRYMYAPLRACNAAVLRACERYSLDIKTQRNCSIKFWLRILTCTELLYIKKCYNMLKHFGQLCYINWVTQIQLNLYKIGFGHVSVSQCVNNSNQLLSV